MTTDNLQPSPSIIAVEASAGSGKTHELVKRYVQLLMNPSFTGGGAAVPLKNILAITFTKKATVEMKGRIIDVVRKIALDAFSSDAEKKDFLDAVGLPPGQARQAALRVMDYIIANYSYLQVQTIDSFVNAILQGCSLHLDLSTRFETKTDDADYLSYSLDAVIDRASGEPAVKELLREFLKRHAALQDEIGWQPRQTILGAMDELHQAVNNYGRVFVKAVTCPPETLLRYRKDVYDRIKELRETLPADTHGTFKGSIVKFVEQYDRNFPYKKLSSFFARDQYPMKGKAAPPDAVAALWDTIRQNLMALCTQDALSYFNHYIDIYGHVARELQIVSRKEDILFLSEFNRRAQALFEGGLAIVPEIYYRLSARFRHFLIDEFQDTSELQWTNLLPLVDEMLSNGGTLFYVGDRKQAIYGFRGGEARLFTAIPGQFPGLPQQAGALKNNFRSHRAVVEFNNDVFSAENIARFAAAIQEKDQGCVELAPSAVPELSEVFKNASQQWQPKRPDGFVHAEFIEADSPDDQEELTHKRVVEIVRDLIGNQGYAPGDIAVLGRTGDQLELVTRWLVEENVRVESARTANLRANPVIKEIVSFLRFLNSPIDTVAFVSFITGDIFCAAAGLGRDEITQFVFEANNAMRRQKGEGYLYRRFRDRDGYRAIWDRLIEPFFISVGFVPFYELVVRYLGAFGVLQRFPEDRLSIMRLLEIILERQKENPTLGSFMEYFAAAKDEDLFIDIADAGAVKLLTIHKAKGLQYPVVIVPFFEIVIRTPDRLWRRTKESLSLLHLNEDRDRFVPELNGLRRALNVDILAAELNAGYVALTRAQNQLFVLVPAKAANRRNLAAALFPELPVALGSPTGPAGRAALREDSAEIPLPEYSQAASFLSDDMHATAPLENRAGILRGDLLHYALSLIGNLDGSSADEAVAAAMPVFLRRYPGEEWVEPLLKKIVGSAALRRFFFVPGGTVKPEHQLVTAAGATRIIDRLVIAGDGAQIVDYKSAPAPEKDYGQQVREYMSLAAELYPGLKVTGWILYLDTQTAEEVR